MDSGCHKLSENIWFLWCKRSYSGDKKGCHARGQRRTTNNGRNVKIELEFWEAEFAIISCNNNYLQEAESASCAKKARSSRRRKAGYSFIFKRGENSTRWSLFWKVAFYTSVLGGVETAHLMSTHKLLKRFTSSDIFIIGVWGPIYGSWCPSVRLSETFLKLNWSASSW